MKKTVFILSAILIGIECSFAQSHYWVFLTDKAGTTFDPYSYFDSKAIERYHNAGADLYDISNFPLNDSYVSSIEEILASIENPQSCIFGKSRWLNAVAVTATPDQIAAIQKMPFVSNTVLIGSDMQLASTAENPNLQTSVPPELTDLQTSESLNLQMEIAAQLIRMRGDLFINNNIDGTGIRIAVFDGGFHAVNTHQAFKHLRDNKQIIATWDFTKKSENVYDNHTHGTMVLSCIAGRIGDMQIGLATGATFLLAKTEVDPEPFKEEVWWAEAMEWADKNGADIINSSLGYGKDRHYTWEMDQRSYVAKAANMAARKGILVCNSAGNEGDDNNWKCIITPADADSVLAVGGINASLSQYQHIYFSSYGPSADGRIKPNVCNFGRCIVADPHHDDKTEIAAGTSFASPLTAGFAACAWQTMRNKTAMQMKCLIEQSADLYPYYDYALGYGVPQADFFLNESKRNTPPEPTFDYESVASYILIHPRASYSSKKLFHTGKPDNNKSKYDMTKRDDVVMIKIQDNKGIVQQYINVGLENFNNGLYLAIPKACLVGYTFVAHLNGYTQSFRLTKSDSIRYAQDAQDFEYFLIDTAGYFKSNYTELTNRTLADNRVRSEKFSVEEYIQLGIPFYFTYNTNFSFAYSLGLRFIRNYRKWYGIGMSMEYNSQLFDYKPESANPWDITLGLGSFSNVENKFFYFNHVNVELFQRVRLLAGGSQTNKGLLWDLGIYGGFQYSFYQVDYNENQTANCTSQSNYYYNVDPAKKYNWGFTSRLRWDMIGIYGRYRMSQPSLNLPRFEMGLEIAF